MASVVAQTRSVTLLIQVAEARENGGEVVTSLTRTMHMSQDSTAALCPLPLLPGKAVRSRT